MRPSRAAGLGEFLVLDAARGAGAVGRGGTKVAVALPDALETLETLWAPVLTAVGSTTPAANDAVLEVLEALDVLDAPGVLAGAEAVASAPTSGLGFGIPSHAAPPANAKAAPAAT